MVAGCPLRDPADLAPRGVTVVAAVHQAFDAFACVAVAHLQAVTAADRAGRLYVTTRSLPGAPRTSPTFTRRHRQTGLSPYSWPISSSTVSGHSVKSYVWVYARRMDCRFSWTR